MSDPSMPMVRAHMRMRAMGYEARGELVYCVTPDLYRALMVAMLRLEEALEAPKPLTFRGLRVVVEEFGSWIFDTATGFRVEIEWPEVTP